LVRLVNGGVALVAPQFLAGRVGIDPEATRGASYVFRMFGMRTALIALDLLGPDSRRRDEAIARAPVIHASDAIAAARAHFSGRLPDNSGVTITLLALVARQGLPAYR
jgi:hypothetical protein